ncbi:phage GP46 family protein [Methylomonas sp. BW4-1]|uniref:phage GP46 family protein n=1 Tax=unclassified Methylomonas TaxID=2608980 RepID=UPI001967D7F9|nr:phage GP46 family protein [Methylomonas sp. EFPC1]QSB03465.1 phage GP46 family protein [Methylomonas sp. EFPC1]
MLKLVQIDIGVFDLQFDDPALNDTQAAIETLVYAVLFTDAEAPASRVPDRYERRGWWADPEAGTGIWHVRRQGLSDAARREALSMVEQALLDHGLTEVSVSEQAGAGNVSSVFMIITGLHNGRIFNMSVPL